MSAARSKQRKEDQGPGPAGALIDWKAGLTLVGFWIALVVVGARALTSEVIRSAFDVTPGSELGPREVGPAASILLDLLLCVPALLVLARRVFDREYVLRWNWSHIFAAGLSLWMALSVTWATDRYAAIVGSANWIAAMVLLWSMTQLVRSWVRMRLVGSLMLGLLVLYTAAGLQQRLIQHPANVKAWYDRDSGTSRWDFMKQQNLAESDFQFQQFERNILSGNLQLFGTSANTYAAMLVLLGVVSTGILLHRRDSGDAKGWWIAIAAVFPFAVFVLYHAHSRTAVATVLLAAAMLGVIRKLKYRLAARSRLYFWIGVGVFVLGSLAIVGHGMWHKGLLIQTLTYRWHYWIGAARMVAQYPFTGVGWNNFGYWYASVREPFASEVVKDPHNFIARFAAELGVIGAILAVAWMGRLWWELTRPITPSTLAVALSAAEPRQRGSMALATLAVLVLGLNALVAVDFNSLGAYVVDQLGQRGIGAILLLAALVAGAMQSLKTERLDGRPAPWVLYGVLVGLGVFLIHNLIDFSLFEPGPMCVFALLAGSALGLRQPSMAGQAKNDLAARLTAGVAGVLWAVAISVIWAPIALAQEAATGADLAISRSKPAEATQLYWKAFERCRGNGDYALKAAQAAAFAGSPRWQVMTMIDAAIQSNPRAVKYHIWKAGYELADLVPTERVVRESYAQALRLDPYDVQLRLAYAAALEKLKDAAGAKEQYLLSLQYDAALPEGEPKRLGQHRREEIRQKIDQLGP